jgi:iron(III) transport system substrate-binding protein
VTGRVAAVAGAVLLTVTLASCSSGGSQGGGTLTIYTSASQNVEQALIAAFVKQHPGTKTNVFRAPTGQLNARVAADVRSGGVRADVIWASDPLTMHGYDQQGLLAPWQPANAADIPAGYRTAHFAGVDVLYMVVVTHRGTPAPLQWADLAQPRYRGQLALPDPGFAASALGLLGYFAAQPGYGLGYYRQLKSNGAEQMSAPGDVLTAVEQGSRQIGVTLADAAYADQHKGSPIVVSWPQPGGVPIYAPIGITTKAHRSPLAASFADFVASRAGQAIMAKLGVYVVLPGLGGPTNPAGSAVATPNWPMMFGTYTQTLSQYSTIFGG